MNVSSIISETNRCIGQKSRFLYLFAFDATVKSSPSEYCHNVLYGKTRMVWLLDGERSLVTHVVVATQYRRVTNR